MDAKGQQQQNPQYLNSNQYAPQQAISEKHQNIGGNVQQQWQQQGVQYGLPTMQQSQNAPYFPPQYTAAPQNNLLMPIVDGKFCMQQQTYFIMQNISGAFSGQDYQVHDQLGRLWFKLESQAFSGKGLKTLFDSYGQPVLSLKRNVFSCNMKYRAYFPGSDNNIVFVFNPKIWSLTPKVEIFLGYSKAKKPDFMLRGAFGNRDFQIFDIRNGNEFMLASVTKQRPWENMSAFLSSGIFGLDTYYITVNPNADASFVVCLCALFDQRFDQRK
ncbi:hypothetical protein MIR68_007899 [Amoeboaphelidium protococcarum]|nr:hypothetical protein MIR68_007899 [Amoeboaphelidium protococcarum]